MGKIRKKEKRLHTNFLFWGVYTQTWYFFFIWVCIL